MRKYPNGYLDVYYHLSEIYSCQWGDSLDERRAAIAELEAAGKRGIPVEIMIAKMQELKRVSTDYQSKLSTHILGRFWEKKFVKPITIRPYKYESPDE